MTTIQEQLDDLKEEVRILKIELSELICSLAAIHGVPPSGGDFPATRKHIQKAVEAA